MTASLLKRQILLEVKRVGVVADFYKQKLDERNESTGDFELKESINGIFHQVKSHQQKTVSNIVTYSSRPQPAFMCVDDEYKKLSVEMNDLLKINGKDYRIVAVNNIQEMNVVYDFSLEVVNNGSVEN